MENDLLLNYDKICYNAFAYVEQSTKGANSIVLLGVDWKNKEHKFVIHLINACYCILGSKEIAMDANPFVRSVISRACGSFGKISKAQPNETKYINIPDMLEDLRGQACEWCGVEFTFGDIYDEYYSGRGN
jgi:hypothetical protein